MVSPPGVGPGTPASSERRSTVELGQRIGGDIENRTLRSILAKDSRHLGTCVPVWSLLSDSNRGLPTCKEGALATELRRVVSAPRLELGLLP